MRRIVIYIYEEIGLPLFACMFFVYPIAVIISLFVLLVYILG